MASAQGPGGASGYAFFGVSPQRMHDLTDMVHQFQMQVHAVPRTTLPHRASGGMGRDADGRPTRTGRSWPQSTAAQRGSARAGTRPRSVRRMCGPAPTGLRKESSNRTRRSWRFATSSGRSMRASPRRRAMLARAGRPRPASRRKERWRTIICRQRCMNIPP